MWLLLTLALAACNPFSEPIRDGSMKIIGYFRQPCDPTRPGRIDVLGPHMELKGWADETGTRDAHGNLVSPQNVPGLLLRPGK